MKQSKIQWELETQKNKTIFTVAKSDLLLLISSLEPIVKTGYHYIILSSKKTIRISKQLYQTIDSSLRKSKLINEQVNNNNNVSINQVFKKLKDGQIKLNKHRFFVSKSILNFIKQNVKFQSIMEEKKIILNDSDCSIFKIVPTNSSTFFFIYILDKKFRVTRELYTFLKRHSIEYLNIIRKPQNKRPTKFPTILSWAGSKSKISGDILKSIPAEITNYHEPFLGSGAILMHVLQEHLLGNIVIKKSLFASDSNRHLIEFFKHVQNDYSSFFEALNDRFLLPYSKLTNEKKTDFYYAVRSDFNTDRDKHNIIQSVRFYFLNRTCFSGIFRTNSTGLFNVPYGSKRKSFFSSYDQFMKISQLFENVNFSHQGFESACRVYEKGDFFYLDPPYTKVKETSFTEYTSSKFSNDDFLKLVDICKKLDKSSCFFSMNNSISPVVLESTKPFHIFFHHATKSIKGNLSQVLISNSETQFSNSTQFSFDLVLKER